MFYKALHFLVFFIYHSGVYGLQDKKEKISVFMGWKVGIFKISFDFMGEFIKVKSDGRIGDQKSKLVWRGYMCKELMEKLLSLNGIISILLSPYFVMLQVWQSMFKNPILCVLAMIWKLETRLLLCILIRWLG